MEVGAIAPPPKFAAKINEDYTTPPNFANVKFIKNPRNLNLKDSEKTIVKSEDSPIDVMTKLGTYLSENLNKEAKIQLSTRFTNLRKKSMKWVVSNARTM